MPPATTTRPHIYLRTTAPDGLLSRATLSLTPLLPNGSCSIVAGKRSIALVPNVTGLYPPDVAAHTVGQQIADSGALVSGLLDGIHQVCLVLGLAGSGKTALLEGANPKTAAGGVLDGIVKSLYDALKLKSDNDGGGLASFTLSLSIQEHYSEIVRDLLSSKREKDIPTRINWNDCSCALLQDLTTRSVATYDDCLSALAKAKGARSNIRGRSDKTSVIYRLSLEQNLKSGETWTSDLYIVELFAADRLLPSNLEQLATKEGDTISRSTTTVAAGLASLIGEKSSPSVSKDDGPATATPFDVERSALSWILHPLFESNAVLHLVCLVNMGSDPTLVTSLFAYLVPLVSDMELYPLQGTPAVQHARRVRAAREQRIKAKAESSLDRLALDGDKDEVAQRLVTATRENDSLHSTIAALSTQLADLHEQIKIAAALKDDSEAHLVTATDLRTVAAAQAARLADQLAAATAEADSARRARAAAEDKMEAQSRELAVTSARLRQVETGLEQVQAEKTALEFRVKGMAHELGGEAGQAEELAIEFIKVLGRAEVAEKTKQAMADREQQLLRRVKDLDYERNALTEKVTLLTASTGPKTRATSTPTDAHSLGPEVILVIQRVEADLGTQLGAMNADLAQCREQLHDVTSTFRQRLQHYIDATCQINPNNETLTTLKKIVDAMHKDVLSAVVNSERSAMDGVFGCHKLVSASHQLILHLLRLVMILQGGGGGKATASLQKAIDETEMHHRAFQTVTQSLQALRSPAHTHAATIPVPTVPRVQAQPDPRAEIAAYIQQTHRQLEEERAELLTRALVAEGMVKLLLGSRPH